MHQPDILVIMPTVATRERADHLRAAIASVLGQQGVNAIALVVANGDCCDPDLIAELQVRRDIRLLRIDEGSQQLALEVGREQVDTAYFSELDDDDELLPDALRRRLQPMLDDQSVDAVVTNALMRYPDGDAHSIIDIESVRQDPLHALLERNWLIPGSMLLRTAAFPAPVFAAMPQYLEWTYLAFVMALRHKVHFIEQTTVVHHMHLPFSIDDSLECVLGRPRALRNLLALPLPPSVRQPLELRLGALYHHLSSLHLSQSHTGRAWGYHLKSLACRRGWTYLSYTRHLFRQSLGLHTSSVA